MLGLALWPVKRLFRFAMPWVLLSLVLWVGWKTVFAVDWIGGWSHPTQLPNQVAGTAQQVVQQDFTPQVPGLVEQGANLLYAWCDGVSHFGAQVIGHFSSYLVDEFMASRSAANPTSAAP
jgi:hypothetical protein